MTATVHDIGPPATAPTPDPLTASSLGAGPSVSTTVTRVLLSLSALTLWAVVYVMLLSARQEARQQHLLYANLREHLAEGTTPTGGDIAPGTPVAMLQVPSIGIHDLVVVEGTAASQTEGGPGHRRDTPLPGQVGVSVLMGRGTTFGAPFAGITRLHRGAVIHVATGQGSFTYKVDGVRRAGAPLPQPLAQGAGRLTLVTSVRKVWSTAAIEAVNVDATLVGTAQTSTSDAIAAIDPSEAAMAGDRGALPALLIWLQALLVVAIAITWAQARWARKPALLVGAPAFLAVLWVATETAARLLPNLL